jgi:hypothetical protein
VDTLVLKNNGNSPLYVNDLGIEVKVGEDFDLLQSFTAEDITESLDFPLVFSQGGEIVLNGTTQMSLQNVLDYLTPLTRWDKLDYSYISGKDDITNITNVELEELTDGSTTELHNHDGRYYTETELQTPGGAQVHYDNIVGMPSGSNKIVAGDLYYQDPSRANKWLSTSEIQYSWTEKVVDGKYMSIGHVSSAATGYLLPQDFTITKLSITSTSNPTKQMQIRINNSPVHTFNLSGGLYINNTLNIDTQQGDVVKMFVSGAGQPIKNVVVSLFGKWRTV